MWWGWTASRRVRPRSSVSLASSSRCSVLLLYNPCAERRRLTYLRLCADNLDAYTYESIIVGYFSLFVR